MSRGIGDVYKRQDLKTVPSLISASFSIIELEKNQCLMYLITSGVLLLKYTVI